MSDGDARALDARALPELVDVRAWLGAPEPRQRAVLNAITAALGPGFEVVYGDPDPRARDAQTTETFAALSLQGGLRVEHAASGLLLCLVPGGVATIGLSDQELAVFDEPEVIDAARPPDLDDMRALHVAAPFMRGAHGNTLRVPVAPFLMVEAPLSAGRLSRLGLVPHPGADEVVGFAEARALAGLPAPLRLPTEAEWEHACRAGSASPFPFSDVPPAELGDPLHPLGLSALGHFPEATSDPWRRHLEAGVAAPPAAGAESLLGVVRGGAALHLPWSPGGGGWLRLLSAWRATWFRAREKVAVRPVMSLPCPAPSESAPPRRPSPIWRMARRTSDLLGRFMLPDPAAREAARAELLRSVSGFGVWTGQGAAALPWLVELTTQEMMPERDRLLVMIADIASGDHAATIVTGVDRTLPHVAEVASHAPARSIRQALLERLPKLCALASDIDAKVRAAVPLVTTLMPEAEASVRPALETAFARERDPAVRASFLLGLARLDRFARRAPSKALFADPSPLLAGAARLGALACDANALADQHGPIAAAHDEALLAFIRLDVEPELMPWYGGRLAALVARYLADCLPDGGIIAGLILARLVREAGLSDDPRVTTWAEGAVHMALTGAFRRRLDALDARQWQVIADVSRRDFPEIAAAWRAAGLPASMAERRTLAIRHRGKL